MLSIIIPTLNEAATLPATLAHTIRAADGAALEFIVSDCGSGDGTLEMARAAGLRAINGAICRADALNRGAALARGEVLLFLHADTLLPVSFAHLIERGLRDGRCVAGAFDFEFAVDPEASAVATQLLGWVVLCNRIRYRWTGNFYGDQAMFVRREVFDRAGGFPRVRLMEDIRLSRRLRRFGRAVILRPPVKTSPRRFVARGVVRQFVEDLALLGIDNLGICPRRRWDDYNALNRAGNVCVGKPAPVA